MLLYYVRADTLRVPISLDCWSSAWMRWTFYRTLAVKYRGTARTKEVISIKSFDVVSWLNNRNTTVPFPVSIFTLPGSGVAQSYTRVYSTYHSRSHDRYIVASFVKIGQVL